MSEINISIDDVKGIFKALSYGNLNSIFETRTLSFFKSMNEKYGTTFDLLCTYKQEKYSLGNVSDKYVQEFAQNQDWLRFGFHCYDEEDVYGKRNSGLFENEFNMFLRDLEYCTGQKKILDKIRLHGFQGNIEQCKFFRSKGIKVLFTADDCRKSYYLGKEEQKKLSSFGYYYDPEVDICFFKSCTRLENSIDIISEIKECKKKRMPIVPVFTHEWQMDNCDIRRKIELCCKIGKEIK